MNRRAFLATAAGSIAVGLAGCTSASCDDAASGAAYTTYAAREAIFVDMDGDVGPNQVTPSDMAELEARIGATQEFTPVSKSDQFDPDGYGPYVGFFIHENTSKDVVENAFEAVNLGTESESPWFEPMPPSDWGRVNDRIQERRNRAQNLSASTDGDVTVPPVRLRETGSNEAGEQAAWDIYDVDSKDKAKSVVYALSQPTGLAVRPEDSEDPAHRSIVKPHEFIDTVDVVQREGTKSDMVLYDVEIGLKQEAVDGYIESVDYDVEELSLILSPGYFTSVDVTEGTENLLASKVFEYWTNAYAYATPLLTETREPLYTGPELTSCSSGSTTTN